MFGFRLKAKSEHEAAQVLSWYGVGTGMVGRVYAWWRGDYQRGTAWGESRRGTPRRYVLRGNGRIGFNLRIPKENRGERPRVVNFSYFPLLMRK